MVELINYDNQPHQMYNLTVDADHTFFVGKGQWLVHNGNPCQFQENMGHSVGDANLKGFHFDYVGGKGDEIKISARFVNGQYQLVATTQKGNVSLTPQVLQQIESFLTSNASMTVKINQGIVSTWGTSTNAGVMQNVANSQLLVKWFSDPNIVRQLTVVAGP